MVKDWGRYSVNFGRGHIRTGTWIIYDGKKVMLGDRFTKKEALRQAKWRKSRGVTPFHKKVGKK